MEINPRILLVDDQEFVLAIVKKMLEQVGMPNVNTARDADNAIRLARQDSPDIIICDIQMRPKDGFAFFAALQEEDGLKSIPVLMLTAHQDSTIHARAKDAGVKGLLSKPVQGAALKEAIISALATD